MAQRLQSDGPGISFDHAKCDSFGFIRSRVRFGAIFHPGPGAPDGARVVHMEMISLFSCFCSFASIH